MFRWARQDSPPRNCNRHQRGINPKRWWVSEKLSIIHCKKIQFSEGGVSAPVAEIDILRRLQKAQHLRHAASRNPKTGDQHVKQK